MPRLRVTLKTTTAGQIVPVPTLTFAEDRGPSSKTLALSFNYHSVNVIARKPPVQFWIFYSLIQCTFDGSVDLIILIK